MLLQFVHLVLNTTLFPLRVDFFYSGKDISDAYPVYHFNFQMFKCNSK